MRRDPELIRKLVLYIEDHDEVNSTKNRADFPEHDEITVARHIQLLIEDGFAEGKILKIATPPGIAAAFADRLTSRGHDFADDVRNESVWRKVVAFVAEKGGSVSLAVLTEVTKTIARAHFGV